MRRSLPLTVVLVLLCATVCPGRKWKDKSGTHEVEAELVGVTGDDRDVAVLKKTDGQVIRVPLNLLSPADQKFVQGELARLAKGKQLTLRGDGVLTGDGFPQLIPVEELAMNLVPLVRGVARVEFQCAPTATVGVLERAIQGCGRARVTQFALRDGEEAFEFEAPLAVPAEGLPSDLEIPPMLLRLRADAKGDVASILLNGQQAASFEALQHKLVDIVGTDRGPGSIQAAARLEVRGDADLKLKHVMAAWKTVSYYEADGKRVALIDHVSPVGFGGVELVEEMIEDLKPLESVEPLDVAPIELAPSGDVPALADIPKGARRGAKDAAGDAADLLSLRNQRAVFAARLGGNERSEAAVDAALRWIVAHQLPDGGWSFDHQHGACDCGNQGSLKTSRNAATSLALLPLLGAGHTHRDGEYKQQVKRGLYYLLTHQKLTPGGGSFLESGGTMYSHALGAITVCEAYALTQDRGLLKSAQAAVNFIANAQDPVGGGWRYAPRSPGDTSVLGWQLAALRAAQAGRLEVAPQTLQGASKFLDAVQTDEGATYGYTSPGKGPSTTAIGLLARMELGWKPDHEPLVRGIKFLSQRGPSRSNLYHNYYANQVLIRQQDDAWKRWNTTLRDFLIQRQEQDGHAKGSWHLGNGDHGAERGGRLYTTALATLILEAYYRYPLPKE